MHARVSPISLPVPRVSYAPPTLSGLSQSKDSVRLFSPVMQCFSGDVCQEALIHVGCVVRMASDELFL